MLFNDIFYENFRNRLSLWLVSAQFETRQSENQYTPLYYAVRGDDLEIAKQLLASSEVDVNCKTQAGVSALFLAILSKNFECAYGILNTEEVDYQQTLLDKTLFGIILIPLGTPH